MGTMEMLGLVAGVGRAAYAHPYAAAGLVAVCISIWGAWRNSHSNPPPKEKLKQEGDFPEENFKKWQQELKRAGGYVSVHKEIIPRIKEYRRSLRWRESGSEHAIRGFAWMLELEDNPIRQLVLQQLLECLQDRRQKSCSWDALVELEFSLTNLLIHKTDLPESVIEQAAEVYEETAVALSLALPPSSVEIEETIAAMRKRAAYLSYRTQHDGHFGTARTQYHLLATRQRIEQTLANRANGARFLFRAFQEGAAAHALVSDILNSQDVINGFLKTVTHLGSFIEHSSKMGEHLSLLRSDWSQGFAQLDEVRFYGKLLADAGDQGGLTDYLKELPKIRIPSLALSWRERMMPASNSLPRWVFQYAFVDLLATIATHPHVNQKNRREACLQLSNVLKGVVDHHVIERLGRVDLHFLNQQEDLKKEIIEKTSSWKSLSSPHIRSLQHRLEQQCRVQIGSLKNIRRVEGRHQELSQIADQLFQQEPSFIALEGPPGSGKTTLTQCYLQRHLADYDDIFILSAVQHEVLVGQLETAFKDFQEPREEGDHRLNQLVEQLKKKVIKDADQGKRSIIVIEDIPPTVSSTLQASLQSLMEVIEADVHLIFHLQNQGVRQQLHIPSEKVVVMSMLEQEDATVLFLNHIDDVMRSYWPYEKAQQFVQQRGRDPQTLIEAAMRISEERIESLDKLLKVSLRVRATESAKGATSSRVALINDLEAKDSTMRAAFLALCCCDPHDIDLHGFQMMVELWEHYLAAQDKNSVNFDNILESYLKPCHGVQSLKRRRRSQIQLNTLKRYYIVEENKEKKLIFNSEDRFHLIQRESAELQADFYARLQARVIYSLLDDVDNSLALIQLLENIALVLLILSKGHSSSYQSYKILRQLAYCGRYVSEQKEKNSDERYRDFSKRMQKIFSSDLKPRQIQLIHNGEIVLQRATQIREFFESGFKQLAPPIELDEHVEAVLSTFRKVFGELSDSLPFVVTQALAVGPFDRFEELFAEGANICLKGKGVETIPLLVDWHHKLDDQCTISLSEGVQHAEQRLSEGNKERLQDSFKKLKDYLSHAKSSEQVTEESKDAIA